MATFEEAKAQKDAAYWELCEEHAEVSGIGLCPLGEGDWALKVNLRQEPEEPLPLAVRGIPIVAEVVGDVRAL